MSDFVGSSDQDPAKRAIRPRKSHIKSRNGCSNCKRRRIKCDEQRPQCLNCRKHGIDCDYVGQGDQCDFKVKLEQECVSPSSSISSPDVAAYPTTPVAPSAGFSNSQLQQTPQSSQSRKSVQAQDEFASLHMAQLELLHHFLTVTAPTLTDVTDGDLWLVQIPKMAFRHEFLMHAILTIAATHMRYLQEKAKAEAAASSMQIDPADLACEQDRQLYYERAEIWYRQLSLETFRQAISGPRTAGNLEAMTVAGSLIAIQSFAYRERESDDLTAATIISVDRWLPILLGIRAVVHEMQNMQTGIDLQSIFGIDFSVIASQDPNAPSPLLSLQTLFSDAFTDPRELDVYTPAIHLLALLVEAFKHARPAELRKYVFTWPFLLSEDFHTRLRQRDTFALIVFVHYLALLSLLNAWWQEERVLADVQQICTVYLRNEKWRPWLEWILEVLPFPVFDFVT
ncbi:hypothetical protein V1512DRAFT_248214 [Lipomyces arxii]|uniref:uncharacterized protein n=1 Tax=Lipomyces arxii TaxID=56418 RepID=UPI0034CDB77B